MSRLVAKTVALARSGREIPDRLLTAADYWLGRFSAPSQLGDVMKQSELEAGFRRLALNSYDYLTSEALLTFEEALAKRKQDLSGSKLPFEQFHNGTITLGRLSYAVCRAIRPRKVVETGVAYGVTSAYILQALSENGRGELFSVDLPPLARNSHQFVGCLIPPELRKAWNLRVGSCKKVLPALLEETGEIDVFLHDSLHTYSHMTWEFKMAFSVLRAGGLLISDDIEGNRAFEKALRLPQVASWFAIRQEDKHASCGVIRLRE